MNLSKIINSDKLSLAKSNCVQVVSRGPWVAPMPCIQRISARTGRQGDPKCQETDNAESEPRSVDRLHKFNLPQWYSIVLIAQLPGGRKRRLFRANGLFSRHNL